MHISSFEDLADLLRTFRTWGDRGGYDFGGAMHLLGACLDNLRKNATETDLEELVEGLEPEQITFLCKLSRLTNSCQ